jgi:hypothetical protein
MVIVQVSVEFIPKFGASKAPRFGHFILNTFIKNICQNLSFYCYIIC